MRFREMQLRQILKRPAEIAEMRLGRWQVGRKDEVAMGRDGNIQNWLRQWNYSLCIGDLDLLVAAAGNHCRSQVLSNRSGCAGLSGLHVIIQNRRPGEI